MKHSAIMVFASIEQFWKTPNNDRHSDMPKQTFSNKTRRVCDSKSFGIPVDIASQFVLENWQRAMLMSVLVPIKVALT